MTMEEKIIRFMEQKCEQLENGCVVYKGYGNANVLEKGRNKSVVRVSYNMLHPEAPIKHPSRMTKKCLTQNCVKVDHWGPAEGKAYVKKLVQAPLTKLDREIRELKWEARTKNFSEFYIHPVTKEYTHI